MMYEVKTMVNNEEKIVLVNDNPNLTDLAKCVGAIIDFMNEEERVENGKNLIRTVNKHLKNNVIDNIVYNSEDYIASILNRVTFPELLYNVKDNTIGINSIAKESNINIYITYLDIKKRITELNKALDKDNKLKFKGDFNGINWKMLVILHNILTDDITSNHIAELEKIVENTPAAKYILKGFIKYLNGNESGTAQTEILQYFYSLFNTKTGKNIKPVNKYKDTESGKIINVFDFMKAELITAKSKIKSLNVKTESTTLYSLINQYITSEDNFNIKNKSTKFNELNFEEEKKVEEVAKTEESTNEESTN